MKKKTAKQTPPKRAPLSRVRVIDAAMAMADAQGLDAVTLRAVAEQLGVEAMSLYKHVANKDDILDGLMERVFEEIPVPAITADWRAFLRERAVTTRAVLLRHRWAAMLIESRMTPVPARLRMNNAVIGALRAAGFSVELAYSTFVALDSYIYGFTLQEVWTPFEPEGRPDVVEGLRPAISATEYPHLVEMMDFLSTRATQDARVGASTTAGYSADFEFGLDLLLDGLDRARALRC